jgi:hypothetical protein
MTSMYISPCGQSSRGSREEDVGWKSTRPDKRSVHGGLLFYMFCRDSSSIADLGGVSGIGWREEGIDWALLRDVWCG